MKFYDLPSQKTHQPYNDEGLNKIYNLLFCDNLELYKSDNATTYPWNVLFAAAPDIEELKKVSTDTQLDTRYRVLAFNLLSEKGVPQTEPELLGVIVEVALADGLDVLAAFEDGTARYINHSGRLIVWETRTEESDKLIGQLFADAKEVVSKIGVWEEARRPFPETGMVRLSFLVSNGLYFGEGPFDVLSEDPMGGPVIDSATQLMVFVVSQPLQDIQ